MTYFPLHQTTCFFIPLVAPCKPLLGIEKIYIETGMMKKCEDVERVIKEKGYLRVKIK